MRAAEETFCGLWNCVCARIMHVCKVFAYVDGLVMGMRCESRADRALLHKRDTCVRAS